MIKHAHDRVPEVAGWDAERELICMQPLCALDSGNDDSDRNDAEVWNRVLFLPARCVSDRTRPDSKRVVKQANVHVSMNARARVSDGCVGMVNGLNVNSCQSQRHLHELMSSNAHTRTYTQTQTHAQGTHSMRTELLRPLCSHCGRDGTGERLH